ncbi:MAG: hypothetical protein Q9204_004247 [Flavoplaca sp. TL-2023a]
MSATSDVPANESLNIMSRPLTDGDEKGTMAKFYPQPSTWNSMLRDMSAYIRLLEEQENRMARLPTGLGGGDLAQFKQGDERHEGGLL